MHLTEERTATRAESREDLPAGPDLHPLVQSIAFARDPVGVLLRCRARYGPVFTLRFVTVGPVVVIAAPNEALEIIHGDPESAHAGEARRAVLPQASPLSSFGADGGQHDAARGRIAPALSVERIERLEGEATSISEKHVEALPRNAPIRVLSRMRSLTEEVFVRLVLGVDDEARGTAIVKALDR